MGGIGKSTLAAQIAARVSRLQSERVISRRQRRGSGGGLAAEPAEADFVVLDNFDDNLSQRVGPVDGPGPGAGRPARRLDRQAADHLPAPVHPGRAGRRRPGPARLPPARAADPLRRRRAHHLAARDPAARRRRTRPGVAADRGPSAGHGIPGPAAGAGRALPGPGRPRSRPRSRPGPGSRCRGPNPPSCPRRPPSMIASAAGDLMFGELFGRLGTGARSLLVRASVFRLPVTAEALAARPGPIAECEAAGPAHHRSRPTSWSCTAGRRARCTGGWPRPAWAPRWRRPTGRRPRTGCPAAGRRSARVTGYHQRQAAELTRVAGPAPRPGPACAAAASCSRWPPCRSCWRSRPAARWPPRTWPPPRGPPGVLGAGGRR